MLGHGLICLALSSSLLFYKNHGKAWVEPWHLSNRVQLSLCKQHCSSRVLQKQKPCIPIYDLFLLVSIVSDLWSASNFCQKRCGEERRRRRTDIDDYQIPMHVLDKQHHRLLQLNSSLARGFWRGQKGKSLRQREGHAFLSGFSLFLLFHLHTPTQRFQSKLISNFRSC